MNIAELRAQLKAAYERMETAHKALSEPAEDADLEALGTEFDAAEEEHRTASVALERAVRVEEARTNLPVEPVEDDEPAEDDDDPANPKVRVTKEPLTYERHAERSFFNDMLQAREGDFEAAERLNRHRKEMAVEERVNPNQTAGQGGEFVPPIWLEDQWVKLPRPGRAVADTLTHKDRPPGTNSINVPKVATGATAAVQTDAGAVSSTDITSTSITAQVQTIAGMQDVSRQLVELGYAGLDEVIFDDLMRDYEQKLDVAVINGAVTNAKGLIQLTGINAVTWTEATPTTPLLYPKLANGIVQIHSGIFAPPQVIAMHPRRWGFILASLDTQNRPLVVPDGSAYNGLATMAGVSSEAVVGGIQGVPVVVDASIPSTNGAGTNEDVILIYRADNIFLYEDALPTMKVYEEVLSGTGQIRFQVFGYYAIAERLAKAISKVAGTGLVTPSF